MRVFVVGVLVVVVGVLVSIALHEVGHLVPAKRFGVKVTKYMVGFGPTLWSRTRGETEYGLKAIPLGGYIRMIGMYPPARPDPSGRGRAPGFFAAMAEDARSLSAEEVRPGDERRTFYALSVPKKLVVMLGGPTMNLLIAVVLMAVVLSGFGAWTLTTTLGYVAECVPAEVDAECAPGDPAGPSAQAGLQEGDHVVSWGGVAVEEWADLSSAIRAGGTEPVEVVVLRDGEELTTTVAPVLALRPVVQDGAVVTDADGEPVLAEVPFAGLGPRSERVPQPLSSVPPTVANAVGQTVAVVATLPQQVIGSWQAAVNGGERETGVVGIVGVGRFAGEIASADVADYGLGDRFADLLAVIAGLNIALFVFNLVPLPPLDGGHVAGALWEGLRRTAARLRHRPDPGPADVAKAMPLAYAVVLLLVGMTLALTYADIVRPITLGG